MLFDERHDGLVLNIQGRPDLVYTETEAERVKRRMLDAELDGWATGVLTMVVLMACAWGYHVIGADMLGLLLLAVPVVFALALKLGPK